MSLDIFIGNIPYISVLTPSKMETVEDLKQQAIESLEAEAEDLPMDRRQSFLASVRQHAGNILKILEQMEARGTVPHVFAVARTLFDELKTIGTEFAKATEVNHQQFIKEMSAYERYKDFHLNLPDLYRPEEHHVPTFAELMEVSRQANAKANAEQNIVLAKLTADAMRKGFDLVTGAAKSTFCNASPVHAQVCKFAEPYLQKAITEVGETLEAYTPKNRALSLELYGQHGIPLEEGEKYGENAFVVATTLLPLPPVVKWVGTAKPMVSLARFLKSDAGSVKIPFQKGLQANKSETLKTVEKCAAQLNTAVEDIAKTKPSFQYYASLSDIVFDFEQDLKLHLPDLGIGRCCLRLPQDMHKFSKRFFGKIPESVSLLDCGNSKDIYVLTFANRKFYVFEGEFPELINTILGNRWLRALQLKHSEVPVLKAVGRSEKSAYLILTDLGETLEKSLQKLSPEFSHQSYRAGMALGEMHAKETTLVFPGGPLHSHLVDEALHLLYELWEVERCSSKSNFEKFHNKITKKFSQVPLTAGFTHGDLRLDHLTWNPKTQKVGLIDLELVADHFNMEMRPSGLPISEYYDVINSILNVGTTAQVPRGDLTKFIDSFKKGYKSVNSGGSAEIEALLDSLYELLYPLKGGRYLQP